MPRIPIKARVLAATAAAAALGTVGVGTAQAATTPGIANDLSRAVVATETPAHGLKLYWQANGTTPWHAETVAGPGTTFSAPTVTRDGSLLIIAAEGPSNSLEFYWQLGSGWHREIVAGPGAAISAPSVATFGGRDVIAVQGAGDTLHYYWQNNVLSPWHGQTVAGILSTFSAPSVTQAGSRVVIAAEGAGQTLRDYYTAAVPGGWIGNTVDGPGSAVSAPSVTTDGGLILLASEGKGNVTGGSVNFYWTNVLPLWHPESVVAGGATSAPSLSVNPGVFPARINVAFAGPFGTLSDYSQPTGQNPPGWQIEQVAGIGSTLSAPSASYNTVGNLIAAAGPGNSLRFYWEANGFTNWNPETVPGAVVAP